MTTTLDLLPCVLVICCLCVLGTFAACSEGSNEVVEGVLGRDISLSCTPSLDCDTILWRNDMVLSSRNVLFNKTHHTSIEKQKGTSTLSILSGVTFYDAGFYSCWCLVNSSLASTGAVCSVTLTTICQSTVFLNGDKLVS